MGASSARVENFPELWHGPCIGMMSPISNGSRTRRLAGPAGFPQPAGRTTPDPADRRAVEVPDLRHRRSAQAAGVVSDPWLLTPPSHPNPHQSSSFQAARSPAGGLSFFFVTSPPRGTTMPA